MHLVPSSFLLQLLLASGTTKAGPIKHLFVRKDGVFSNNTLSAVQDAGEITTTLPYSTISPGPASSEESSSTSQFESFITSEFFESSTETSIQNEPSSTMTTNERPVHQTVPDPAGDHTTTLEFSTIEPDPTTSEAASEETSSEIYSTNVPEFTENPGAPESLTKPPARSTTTEYPALTTESLGSLPFSRTLKYSSKLTLPLSSGGGGEMVTTIEVPVGGENGAPVHTLTLPLLLSSDIETVTDVESETSEDITSTSKIVEDTMPLESTVTTTLSEIPAGTTSSHILNETGSSGLGNTLSSEFPTETNIEQSSTLAEITATGEIDKSTILKVTITETVTKSSGSAILTETTIISEPITEPSEVLISDSPETTNPEEIPSSTDAAISKPTTSIVDEFSSTSLEPPLFSSSVDSSTETNFSPTGTPVPGVPTLSSTSIPPSTTTVPSDVYEWNLQFAKEFNKIYMSLTEDSACLPAQVACINGNSFVCSEGGIFGLTEVCGDQQVCAAMPMNTFDGVVVGCTDRAIAEEVLGFVPGSNQTEGTTSTITGTQTSTIVSKPTITVTETISEDTTNVLETNTHIITSTPSDALTTTPETTFLTVTRGQSSDTITGTELTGTSSQKTPSPIESSSALISISETSSSESSPTASSQLSSALNPSSEVAFPEPTDTISSFPSSTSYKVPVITSITLIDEPYESSLTSSVISKSTSTEGLPSGLIGSTTSSDVLPIHTTEFDELFGSSSIPSVVPITTLEVVDELYKSPSASTVIATVTTGSA